MSVILKGSIRGKSKPYAEYLLHNPKNENVRVFEISGTASPQNAYDSIIEIGGYERFTRSEKPFLQVVMNFDNSHNPSDEEWRELLKRTQERIGYEGQPCVHIMHEYEGKWHMHATWGRFHAETKTMLPVDHIGLELKAVSLEHALEYKHEHLLSWQEKKALTKEQSVAEEQRLKDEKMRQFILNSMEVEAKQPEPEPEIEDRFTRMQRIYEMQKQHNQDQEHSI